MTVTTTTASQTFQGNSTATAFPCTFEIFEDTDINVYFVNPATGTQTQAVLNTDYTVVGAGASAGFTVNTTVAVPTGTNLYVVRALPLTQLIDLTNQGAFFPNLHEAAFDRLCMQIQQIANYSEGLNVTMPPGLVPQPSTLFPIPQAGSLIGWNAAGTALVNTGPTAGVGGISDLNVATNAAIAGTKLAFLQAGTGAVNRTVQDKQRERLSVKDFGAKGDGITDDTAATSAALTAVLATGGKLYFPAGKYVLSAALTLDLRGITGEPDTNRRRVDVLGDGQGNTTLVGITNSTTVLTVIGDNPLTSASHALVTIQGLAFVGGSPAANTVNGLKLQDVAYLCVRDCSFTNCNAGLILAGCLSSVFDNLLFQYSNSGVEADASASAPNSNLWMGCEFRNLATLAYDGQNDVAGLTFLNCRFEACGTQGNSATGAVIQRITGANGEQGLTILSSYFENNAGGFDVNVQQSTSTRVALNIQGSCFNRISSSQYTTNNIVCAGNVDVNLWGNSFTPYNTYTPDVSRLCLSLASTCRLRDLGNRFASAVDGPFTGQSLPYAGLVNGSLGASTTGSLPLGWSVARTAAGVYSITHNLGHTNYAVTATTRTTNTYFVQRYNPSANSVQIIVVDMAGTLTDSDFTFSLSVLNPAE